MTAVSQQSIMFVMQIIIQGLHFTCRVQLAEQSGDWLSWLKGMFRISRKGGGYPFFTHTKNETEQSKISLSRISPTTLYAPFARFAPSALISFRHPWGGGTHF